MDKFNIGLEELAKNPNSDLDKFIDDFNNYMLNRYNDLDSREFERFLRLIEQQMAREIRNISANSKNTYLVSLMSSQMRIFREIYVNEVEQDCIISDLRENNYAGFRTLEKIISYDINKGIPSIELSNFIIKYGLDKNSVAYKLYYNELIGIITRNGTKYYKVSEKGLKWYSMLHYKVVLNNPDYLQNGI